MNPSEALPDFSFHIYFPHKEVFQFPVETYDCWTCFLLVSGRFRYQMPPWSEETVHPGDAVLCPPDTPFYRQTVTPIRMHMIKFYQTPAALSPGLYTPADPRRLLEDARRIEGFSHDLSPRDNETLRHYCTDIWLTLGAVPAKQQVYSAPVQALLDLLQKDLSADLSDQTLARWTGLSQTRLIQRFKKETGQTPHQYIIARRIQAAKTLLLSGCLPVCDIARQCGYPDALYFSRQFHRATGLSPTDFRRLGAL